MINKIVQTMAEAMAGMKDGMTVLLGGFGLVGQPNNLVDALIETGVKDLTVVANNAGGGTTGLTALMEHGRVRKLVCSFPRSNNTIFEDLYRAGKIELEIVPQGTMAERIRAAGAGVGAFFTPTGVGTKMAEGKEVREINGRMMVMEYALPGLYPPVELRGRHFVDGALRRTMHASVVLERDVDLMIGINPLVPFNPGTDAYADAQAHRFSDRRIAEGGFPGVISQALRTMLQSRMQVGLARYPQQYPNIDQVVFEPNAGDRELFYTNIFSFAARRRISQLAYRNTLADLRKRRDELAPVLARHGIRLRPEVIADRPRSIIAHLPEQARSTETTAILDRALDEIEHRLREGKRAHARGMV